MATHADVFRLTPEQVDRLRRAHIALALTELLAESDGGDVAVGEIVARAGVSRRTFYRLFDGKDQAHAAAATLAFEQTLARMRAACRAEPLPAERVPAAVRAVLELAADHPERARLWVAEPVMEALPGLLAALDTAADPDAPSRADPGPPPPRDLATALIDATVNDDRTTLRALRADPTTAAPADAALAGGPRAVLELTGGLPSRGPISPQGLQALRLIADHPDSSAADVRAALGHRHASQTSRLLRRLADAGLLVADAPDARPVRWRLTHAHTATLARAEP